MCSQTLFCVKTEVSEVGGDEGHRTPAPPVTVSCSWGFSLQIYCMVSLILTPEGTLIRLVSVQPGRKIKRFPLQAKASVSRYSEGHVSAELEK